jgi:hypothetical protein
MTNVTGLTKGEYKFQLTVIDGNDNSAYDSVTVAVTQSKLCIIFRANVFLYISYF